MKKLVIASIAMTGCMMAATAADAATFLIRYSGAEFGNTATAEGKFTIDDAALASVNKNLNPSFSTYSDLTLTVLGTALGDGTFSLFDFQNIRFRSPSSLDFSRELIGQKLSNGLEFGDRASIAGDFNLFRQTPNAPTGSSNFVLRAANSGELLGLVSLAPVAVAAAVPEPTTWAMIILGMGMVGGAMRRRKSAVTTRVSYAV